MDAGERGNMEVTADQRTISAREGLLDAVEALEPHGEAVILVGAQAVYMHTGEADAGFAVSPFTYDADIALDPALLEAAGIAIATLRLLSMPWVVPDSI